MITNKKGQGGSEVIPPWALYLGLLVILAIIAYLVLSGAFGNIINLRGSETINDVRNGCNLACGSDPNAFCNQIRDLKYLDSNNKMQLVKVTCASLLSNKDVNSNDLANIAKIRDFIDPCSTACTSQHYCKGTATKVAANYCGTLPPDGCVANGCTVSADGTKCTGTVSCGAFNDDETTCKAKGCTW